MSPIMVNVSLTESLTSLSYLSGQNKQHYITCNVNLLCIKQKLPDHSKKMRGRQKKTSSYSGRRMQTGLTSKVTGCMHMDVCVWIRRGSRIFERGGSRHGYKIFHKHTPPLDIVRVTSSDLRKFEKHPHSWTFTKGGGPTLGPMLKSLHRGPKGGGPDPLDPPWIRHCGCMRMSLTSISYLSEI